MAANRQNVPLTMSDLTTDLQQNRPTSINDWPATTERPVVIGLYGIPGSGKTFLLEQLKRELSEEEFAFYEGSEMIATVVPGGIEAFKKLEESQKVHWRQIAIDTIRKTSADSGKVAIVAGHFMFWSEEEEAEYPIYTQNDLETFTHILYLDIPSEIVMQRRLDDNQRDRPSTSVAHIHKWQLAEKTKLRRLCREHRILFSLISSHLMLNKLVTLLHDFRHHTESYNLCMAKNRLDEIIVAGEHELDTMLVLDADKTLAAEDTGALFSERQFSSQQTGEEDCLRALFNSPLGYSYTAFRQATLMYEESADDQEFEARCYDVASAVTMHPEFVSLLRLVTAQEHVSAIVVTCGLRRVWEIVLGKEGLNKNVQVIGGGRISDGFVVTATVKSALVERLRHRYHIFVYAFGDSPLDLEMLCKADQAIVVVGEEQTRSKTMDMDLFNLIYDGTLRACQVLLPNDALPRLDTDKLPLIQLSSEVFINSVLQRRIPHSDIQVLHATNKNAAKLLMTPMRDAKNAGPALREAHRRVGWYLATEFILDVIGIEEYPTLHVQGHHTSGFRLLQEQRTLIVAIMRGGEPMALGVSDAFPLAMFVHASRPGDITNINLRGQHNIILVDSVVNSGKTVVEFVRHVHQLNPTINIVVLAGVIQAQFVSKRNLAQVRHGNLSLVALRLSDNKFTGRGNTDTGNRLFNTTHLL